MCQSGCDQASITGARRVGRPATNASSLPAGITSPPVRWAISSIRARSGIKERNSSAAGSELQPASSRPISPPIELVAPAVALNPPLSRGT